MAISGRNLRKRLLNSARAMIIVGLATAVFTYVSDTDTLDVAIMTNIGLGLALLVWCGFGPESSPSVDGDSDKG